MPQITTKPNNKRIKIYFKDKLMKLNILVILTILCLSLTQCTSNKFRDVKEGMSIPQLKELVGEPDSIRNDFFNEVWFYKTHIVSIADSSVSMVQSIAEMKKATAEMEVEVKELLQ